MGAAGRKQGVHYETFVWPILQKRPIRSEKSILEITLLVFLLNISLEI